MMSAPGRTTRAVASGLLLAIAFVLALLAAQTIAYGRMIVDEPYAPFTSSDEFQRTCIYAYHSVIAEEPYASYTDADEFKRTCIYAYYSVLH